MSVGLVLEGGSMRGMFTAGVIDVFLEHGIDFKAACGVSAGATFGCNIKSRQIGRAIRYNLAYCKDKRYGTFNNYFKTGDMYDVNFCYKELPLELDIFDSDTFASNPMDFYAVATDVETGKAVYYKCNKGLERDLNWIRASASVPIVSNIVEIEGRKLLDGGIADSIPLKFMENKGFEYNVVVLTRPYEYVKEKNKLTPLCKLKYKEYPEFVKAFANRHVRYNRLTDYIKAREDEGKVFAIRPLTPIDVKSNEKDKDKLLAAYEQGRDAAHYALCERNLFDWIEAHS